MIALNHIELIYDKTISVEVMCEGRWNGEEMLDIKVKLTGVYFTPRKTMPTHVVLPLYVLQDWVLAECEDDVLDALYKAAGFRYERTCDASPSRLV